MTRISLAMMGILLVSCEHLWMENSFSDDGCLSDHHAVLAPWLQLQVRRNFFIDWTVVVLNIELAGYDWFGFSPGCESIM